MPGLLRGRNGSLLTNQSLDSWSRGQDCGSNVTLLLSGDQNSAFFTQNLSILILNPYIAKCFFLFAHY